MLLPEPPDTLLSLAEPLVAAGSGMSTALTVKRSSPALPYSQIGALLWLTSNESLPDCATLISLPLPSSPKSP